MKNIQRAENFRSVPGLAGRSLIQIASQPPVVQIEAAVMIEPSKLQTTKFLKGHLLLDGGDLGGSFFQRTVVLICQHDAEGAFGLILNKQTDNKVGDVLVADLP